jgi:hypothetical protein
MKTPSMRRLLPLCLVALSLPLLVGFTGDKGVEAETYVGFGIGNVRTAIDDDPFGEIGGSFRFKFRNFPYDDKAGWIGVAASWHTWPQGSQIGNQLLTILWEGGVVYDWGEFGGGIVVFGELTGVGQLFVLPSVRLRAGDHERVQFGFGMADDAPFWSAGGLMHWEGIFAIPWDKLWAPRVKIGVRVNPYPFVPDERVPIELFGGVEARIGRHVRVSVEGSLGDGGGPGLPPSFTAAVKIGAAVGKGTKSGIKPQSVD